MLVEVYLHETYVVNVLANSIRLQRGLARSVGAHGMSVMLI